MKLPPCEEGGEKRCVLIFRRRSAIIVGVMRQLRLRDRGFGGAGAGFEGVVGEAVYLRLEGFAEAAPADLEFGGAGPLLFVLGVRGGGRRDAGGGAVGDEGRVGRDVGYYIVEV